MASTTPATPACPICSGHGVAHAVEIMGGMRTVSYQCDTCKHQWVMTDIEPKSLWASPPDFVKT